MKKILIIEDEANLANSLQMHISKLGLYSDVAYNGIDGIEKFLKLNPDLVLLDINLPEMNGWEVCKKIRELSNVNIIMMTARDGEIDEIHGLELGADDYIVKPFNINVLIARIKRALRIDNSHNYTYHDLTYNFTTMELSINNHVVSLSKRETQLLEYFIRNINVSLSREGLLLEIWGANSDFDERAVDTLVKRLRKKMDEYCVMIKTLRGIGYIFEEVSI
ncbi:MAG: response regulator transcription factor [Cetobacterium sp.]|uniref:DNA-binding response regulator, OmpR family, contains REC and winged-helix (WHTH) domain n=1 Tax=Cetobacterium ceti TaxID=180163 RepID=A0A1T4MHS6_9FUSO|nr:response regulator transcription factor [Cetobacterium ceti]MCJ8343683.1 response regulator transcription factor [Cetobacterium sp.]SJZ66427.1 DNA-binding response regulator, OmpR family, contains REC and winged-helix (wHTH) domain [Cetobacterium ceti]